MNIEPCPHCYRKVIPMSDGRCPSCGRNTNDLAGTDPHRKLVGIGPNERLPALCFHCGAPTQKRKSLYLEAEPRNRAFGLGAFAGLFQYFEFIERFERYSKTARISIRLPFC